MGININLTEKRTFSYSYDSIKEKLNVDFQKMANESDFIESCSSPEENVFVLKTKEKNIMSKKLSLKTTIQVLINKERGLLHLITQDHEDDNLSFDCKIRMIPDDLMTVVAVKFDGKVDFGFSNLINKGLKKFADKEIEKFLSKTLSSLV